MAEYKPDNWVIVKINSKEHGTYYKVLGGWSGGYLHGDSWRMNSGIGRIEEDDQTYSFYGYSGSVYICNKQSEQIRMNIAPIVKTLEESHQAEIIKAKDIQL